MPATTGCPAQCRRIPPQPAVSLHTPNHYKEAIVRPWLVAAARFDVSCLCECKRVLLNSIMEPTFGPRRLPNATDVASSNDADFHPQQHNFPLRRGTSCASHGPGQAPPKSSATLTANMPYRTKSLRHSHCCRVSTSKA
jgi:hypothetical protein